MYSPGSCIGLGNLKNNQLMFIVNHQMVWKDIPKDWTVKGIVARCCDITNNSESFDDVTIDAYDKQDNLVYSFSCLVKGRMNMFPEYLNISLNTVNNSYQIVTTDKQERYDSELKYEISRLLHKKMKPACTVKYQHNGIWAPYGFPK